MYTSSRFDHLVQLSQIQLCCQLFVCKSYLQNGSLLIPFCDPLSIFFSSHQTRRVIESLVLWRTWSICSLNVEIGQLCIGTGANAFVDESYIIQDGSWTEDGMRIKVAWCMWRQAAAAVAIPHAGLTKSYLVNCLPQFVILLNAMLMDSDANVALPPRRFLSASSLLLTFLY